MSTSTTTVDRRTARREATRARLFEETVSEFSSRGVADTEIAVVAARAGVSRSAFYVHFTDKDEVLRELLVIEEQRISDEARRASGRTTSVRALFTAVVDAVMAAEQRIGRGLVQDLCAAQFRPEFAKRLAVDEHPLGVMLVEEIAARSGELDEVDLAMVFLTGLFGLLATDDAATAERRRRIDMLIELIAGPKSGRSTGQRTAAPGRKRP